MPSPTPVLNDPYEEPTRWFYTTIDGTLDQTRIMEGRRPFHPDSSPIPVKAGSQGSMFSQDDAEDVQGLLVNRLRIEVGIWRRDGYPGTTKVTRELFAYWFLNPDRQAHHRLFFAQREAVETAVWLLEVAPKSNRGTAILAQLQKAREIAPDDPQFNLPRIAFKAATGSGKTVIMAMLILYHFLNRQTGSGDGRFCDQFLIVVPGITIKDRLNVLRVDTTSDPNWRNDYYHQRDLVPPAYAGLVQSLNSRIRITNWHAFQPRTLSGNKASPFDGKKGAIVYEDGSKVAPPAWGPGEEGVETWKQALKRVTGFKPRSRILVLNDEAHHCYYPKIAGNRNDGSATQNAKAAVWFNALLEARKEYELPLVYDLSATPYYLSGSGYEAYSLFPWVVTDFGLTEAIESGLVKIPYLPERDKTQNLDTPVLRDLYRKTVEDDPHAFPRGSDKIDPRKEPSLHNFVQKALKQAYGHWEKTFLERRSKAGILIGTQPVIIIVCNNTALSLEVFRWIAGYEFEDEETGQVHRVKGNLRYLSNVKEDETWESRPPTILVDSAALEEGDQIDADFKKVFVPEIERFRREYRVRHPSRDAEAIEESDILREVMNTVGRANELGSHVRCVVSVNMLTEGWDVNAVTHVVGLRAFDSQLLCEQVAGRALRRESYDPGPDGRFPPEYAQVIGIPFRVFARGKTPIAPLREARRVLALEERARDYEITFPQVDHYRYESEGGKIAVEWDKMPEFLVDGNKYSDTAVMSCPFGPEEIELDLAGVRALRRQEVHWWIAVKLLKHNFIDAAEHPRPEHLRDLLAIVAEWYEEKLVARGDAFKNMVVLERYEEVCESIMKGLSLGESGGDRFRPVWRAWSATGSTADVLGLTRKETQATRKSHVNLVVADSGWEKIAAKFLEEQDYVLSYVKNNFLHFSIPYVDRTIPREYYPDFIARCRLPGGKVANLVIEISGFAHDKDAKKWYVHNRWLPAVNAIRGEYGWEEWRFVEVTDIGRIKETVEAALAD